MQTRSRTSFRAAHESYAENVGKLEMNHEIEADDVQTVNERDRIEPVAWLTHDSRTGEGVSVAKADTVHGVVCI